jgi:starvation-inducible DNA-binding protein
MLRQRGEILQAYGQVVDYDIGLRVTARRESVEMLNQILADTIIIQDLYKKAHWQVSGATFYQLHLLFQKHYEEQAALTDMIAERAQTLGGVSRAVTADVVATTRIERAPSDRTQVPEQLSRLIEAHKTIIMQCREAARRADRHDDLGTADLLVTDVLRTNEKQVWFLSEHLVNAPEVRAVGVKDEKKQAMEARKVQQREKRVLMHEKKVTHREKHAQAHEKKVTHRVR